MARSRELAQRALCLKLFTEVNSEKSVLTCEIENIANAFNHNKQKLRNSWIKSLYRISKTRKSGRI